MAPAAGVRMKSGEREPELPDDEEILALIEQLNAIADDPTRLAALPKSVRRQLHKAAGRVSAPVGPEREAFRKARRRKLKELRRVADEEVLEKTGIRTKRRDTVYQTPHLQAPRHLLLEGVGALGEGEDARRVENLRHCYVCKEKFDVVHHFYDQMCGDCAEFNWAKRNQTADLRGRVALVTGGRVKIGYQACIMLLRAGAHVIVTTRFPRDAARRYAGEDDFAAWGDRLEIYGLDLRHTPSVEAMTDHLLGRLDRLDFIINNACQTVRRPPGFYRHLMADELTSYESLPEAERPLLAGYAALREECAGATLPPGASTAEHLAGVVAKRASASPGIALAPELSVIPLVDGDENESEALFPSDRLDQDEQQVDLRAANSWRMRLADVPTVEFLEVQLVNAVAPFVLNARLKPLMVSIPTRDKHVVNVSAVEGQFYRIAKTDKHPHTNMAKAALNMMTRTSATDYIRDGIHMNAVDTGWVTDEDPAHLAEAKREEHGFTPPLDITDGAARIVDPIFSGFNTGEHVWGQFLKDYKPADW